MKKILQILITIFVTALLVEVLLHVFPDLLPTKVRTFPTLVPDKDLGDKMPIGVDEIKYTLDGKPFRVKTFDLQVGGDIGFRDERKGTSRPFAVVLGDSFVYGHGVEVNDTFVEILEKETGKEFVNVGVPSYGTSQEVKLYQIYGYKLKPNVVILAFFENDYLDNLIFENKIGKEPNPVLYWLSQNSGIYKLGKFFKNFYFQTDRWQRYEVGNETYVFYADFLRKSLFEDRGEHMIELVKESFTDIKSYNTTLIVVFIPYKERVYRQYINQTGLDFEFAEKNFNQICSDLDLNCINLTLRFEKEVKTGKKLYLNPFDGHLNEYGNSVVADEIKNYIDKIYGK